MNESAYNPDVYTYDPDTWAALTLVSQGIVFRRGWKFAALSTESVTFDTNAMADLTWRAKWLVLAGLIENDEERGDWGRMATTVAGEYLLDLWNIKQEGERKW